MCTRKNHFPPEKLAATNQAWAQWCAPARGVPAPIGLPLRFQLRQRVKKARPFEQLPRAPSNDGARKFTSQATRYYLSCISTPPPVALTATPFCVEEMRTITPA